MLSDLSEQSHGCTSPLFHKTASPLGLVHNNWPICGSLELVAHALQPKVMTSGCISPTSGRGGGWHQHIRQTLTFSLECLVSLMLSLNSACACVEYSWLRLRTLDAWQRRSTPLQINFFVLLKVLHFFWRSIPYWRCCLVRGGRVLWRVVGCRWRAQRWRIISFCLGLLTSCASEILAAGCVFDQKIQCITMRLWCWSRDLMGFTSSLPQLVASLLGNCFRN